MTKRASTHGGVAHRMDSIPDDDFDEITNQIDMLTSMPPAPSSTMTKADLGKILSAFESDLFKLNTSLHKETRANRDTLRNFSDECEKTKKSMSDLNVELGVVRKIV